MKNIFISYKQTGISEIELRETLGHLKNNIEKLGNKALIYYFDDNSNLPAKELDKKFLNNIKKSDIFLSFLNDEEKSEGQLMELGMAYSLGKKIILLVNNKIKDNYYLAYGTTDKIHKFENLRDLDFKKILG